MSNNLMSGAGKIVFAVATVMLVQLIFAAADTTAQAWVMVGLNIVAGTALAVSSHIDGEKWGRGER